MLRQEQTPSVRIAWQLMKTTKSLRNLRDLSRRFWIGFRSMS
jgi:hypothetical protein